MSLSVFPQKLLDNYEVYQWRHACAILSTDFPEEFDDIVSTLSEFRLKKSWILEAGGRKSKISDWLDSNLSRKGWKPKKFDTKIIVDGHSSDSPTHEVDCFKNKVALEIEWNNKDPFYDRDLNNFRLLFDLRVISVGIIITRCDELQDFFNSVGKGSSYGASTTHMKKLIPRIDGGGGAGCPIIVFGMKRTLIDVD